MEFLRERQVLKMCPFELGLWDMGEDEGSILSGVYVPESLPLLIYISWEGWGQAPALTHVFYLSTSAVADKWTTAVLDVRRISLFGFLLFTLVYRKDK